MTNTQRHLLKLIKEIDTLCRKNNIIYYLAGGSAIGAIRHRGYIPWDDDADILMTRDNYHKFLEVCKTQLPDNRCMMAQELYREYHNNFARYIDTTTTAIHTNQIVHEDPAGFVIDILILDPIPDDPKEQRKYIKTLELYADLINPASIYSFRWRMNFFDYFRYRLKIRRHGKDKVLKELEQKMFSYKEAECSKYALRWAGVPLISDKDIYGQGAIYQFEDTTVMLPQRAADYLTWHYGDNWMFTPPHTERSTHNAVYCFDTPYTMIKKEAYQYYSVDKTYKQFQNRKILLFLCMRPWWLFRDIAAKRQEIKLSSKYKKHFKSYDQKIHKAYQRKDYGSLSNIYDKYFQNQNKRSIIGREDFNGINRFRYPIYIHIQDYYFLVGIYLLIAVGDTSKALRFLEVKESRTYLSEEEQGLKKYILNLRQAVSFYANKNYKKAQEIVDKLMLKNIESVSTVKLKIRISQKLGTETSEIVHIIRTGEKLTKRIYKNKKGKSLRKTDGEWLKYRADLMINIREAFPYYLRAYEKNLNGIVLLEIKDFISKNYDEFINLIDHMYKNKDIRCLHYISKLRTIFPEDDNICSLWAKCQWLKKGTPKSAWNVIYQLRRSIVRMDNNEKTLEELKNFLYKISGSHLVSQLYCEVIFESELERLAELYHEVETAEIELQWKLLMRIFILYKSGRRKQSIKNSLNLYEITDSSYIRYILCLVFRLELMMYSTFIVDRTKDVKQHDLEYRNDCYIAEWNTIYEDYSKTMAMYKRLKALPKECILELQRETQTFNQIFFERVYIELNKTRFSPTAMIRKIYGLDLFYNRND